MFSPSDNCIIFVVVVAVVLWLFTCRRRGSMFSPEPAVLVETLTTATDQDVADATRYAMKRLCESQGFDFTMAPNGKAWRCDFNAPSCLRYSEYPPKVGEDGEVDKPYYEWNTDLEACILGIADYRKTCEEMGMNYDSNKGKCFITPEYCHCKGLQFKDGDCWKDPVTWLVSQITGDTIATAMTASVNPAFYQCAIEAQRKLAAQKANANVVID
jgi:hypothetical protein